MSKAITSESTAKNLSDHELVRRTYQGDAGARGELDGRYGPHTTTSGIAYFICQVGLLPPDARTIALRQFKKHGQATYALDEGRALAQQEGES